MIKKYWPFVVHAAIIAAGFIDPGAVSAFAAAHPQYATAILGVWAFVMHLRQSPKGDAGSKF